MKTTVLIDFNNLAIRHFLTKDVAGFTSNPDLSLWRYTTFNSIYTMLMKFKKVKEVVVAIDDRVSWRKLYFKRYKESRKKKRDTSTINWPLLYAELNDLATQIFHDIPFKVLKVRNAEADDIIGIICLDGKDKYIVVSNDEDYLQLYSNKTRIYNPSKQDFVVCNNTERFLNEKCLIGQPKDDIFNIKTPLDWPVGKRKPGFGIKSAEKVLEAGLDEWLEQNNLKKRFHINRNLIDFKRIPEVVKNRVLKRYHEYTYPDPKNIYHFFKRNRFRGFLEEINQVENRLLQLY